MDVKPIIEIRGLSKRYALGPEGADRWSFSRLLGKREREDGGDQPDANGSDTNHIWALKDINLDIYNGERVGMIGRNGAGKSTLLKILSRVIYPTEGEAVIRGRVTSLLEVGTGFNNNATGRENIYLNASLHGLSRREIDDRVDDIIAFAELHRFINTPIKHYSSGMRSRLAFAVAAHLDPDILMLDEVLSVGDMAFQQKCLVRMKEMTERGRTLLFVSHSMDSVQRFCDRCVWLEFGRIRECGLVTEVTEHYVSATLNLQSEYVATGQNSEMTNTGREAGHNGSAEPETHSETNSAGARLSDVAKLTSDGGLDAQPPQGRAILRGARIIDRSGKRTTCVETNKAVGVVIQFDVDQPRLFVPSIALHGPDGGLLFWSVPAGLSLDDLCKNPGQYQAVAWLPANLLNVGTYEVSIALVDPSRSPFERYFFVDKALQFQSIEPKASEASSRGIMPRNFPGALRPSLTWSFDQREKELLPG